MDSVKHVDETEWLVAVGEARLNAVLRKRVLALEEANDRARARIAWILTEQNVGPYPEAVHAKLRETHEILFAAVRGLDPLDWHNAENTASNLRKEHDPYQLRGMDHHKENK